MKSANKQPDEPTGEWNTAAYHKQKSICERLTDKGLRIGFQQAASMTKEAREAYADTLRERGYTV